jgi:hypothetical protein
MLVGANQRGIGEWGLAALVEVDGKRLLVDTGSHPETVLRNAEELKIDLAGVTDVVLTHAHPDHRGLITLRRELMKRDPHALERAHVGTDFFAVRVIRGKDDDQSALRSSVGRGSSTPRRSSRCRGRGSWAPCPDRTRSATGAGPAGSAAAARSSRTPCRRTRRS